MLRLACNVRGGTPALSTEVLAVQIVQLPRHVGLQVKPVGQPSHATAKHVKVLSQGPSGPRNGFGAVPSISFAQVLHETPIGGSPQSF
jgi:hypothetical protein